MEYRYLKAFILTAQYSSFSKAANELKIAQSAVSRQIKLLEESVGLELIMRSSKKVILTPKGQELYNASQHFDKLTFDMFDKADMRPIKIGILHGLLETWLNPVLIKFYKKFERNLEIKIDFQPNLKKGISEGHYDMIFSTENIQSEITTSLHLFQEKFIVISKNDINRKKLHDYRWVAYNEYDNIFKATKKHSPNICMVDSITTIINLVKNNVGIACVPKHVLKKTDNLYSYPVNEVSNSEVYMTTLNYKSIPSHMRDLVNTIKDSLE